MLKSLAIRDFGIIDRLEWLPCDGLNVLTGETGAGKSLVLDALDVLLGRRVGQEVVRTGAEKAVIEVVVAVEDDELIAGVQPGSGSGVHEIRVKREVERNGRSSASVDGRTVAVRTLREVSGQLFDIHGPNQQFSLLDGQEQLSLLDGYGGTMQLRAEFASVAEKLRQTKRLLQAASSDDRQVTRRRDMLSFEIGEIHSAELKPDEDVELEQESLLLRNVEKLRTSVGTAYEELSGGEGETPSGTDRIARALQLLREAADTDTRIAGLVQNVESALYQLEDASRDVASYRDSLEYDPARQEQVETRLDLIRTLKRKYGDSLDAVNLYADEAEKELAALDMGEGQREHLEEEEGRLCGALAELGERLSEGRKKAAELLSRAVETELSELNMDGTGFMVSFGLVEGSEDLVLADGTSCGFTTYGVDDVEFLIRPNPGEPFMPLSRTASTGETSRLMLAIRCALSRSDSVRTLVFDEIDIGVGGRNGEVIGRKLAQLAVEHQVICITHLPQVAAYGDCQCSVQKKVVDDRTFVAFSTLSGVERESELSAMLGSLGEPSRMGAKELLSRAAEWKNGAVR
ncbi:MAG: DNA repair protein RecN [Dehalococcoidia bacterium]|nr:DNA repair protein RecN [Dehalococcoidia bacterium]